MERLKNVMKEARKVFEFTYDVNKSHSCDKCGHKLDNKDYQKPGAWNYICPKCGYRSDPDSETKKGETIERLANVMKEVRKVFEFTYDVNKSHSCDKCGHKLDNKDYQKPGAWNYICPKCGHRSDPDSET